MFGLGLEKANAGRVLLLRMDDFLSSPARQLVIVSEFFGLSLEDAAADVIAGSELFQQYAKDASTPWNATIQRMSMEARANMYQYDIEEGVAFAKMLVSDDAPLKSL